MPLLIVRTLGEVVAFALCAFVVGSGLISLARRVARTPSETGPGLREGALRLLAAFGGIALVHALQLTVLLAFVVLAAAFVRELCGARAGAVTAIALLAYPDLTYLATTGYVDAAATAFEIGSLLLVLRWLMRNTASDLPAAALLIGFAVSVKYTALFTAGIVGIAVAAIAVRRHVARPALVSAGIAL